VVNFVINKVKIVLMKRLDRKLCALFAAVLVLLPAVSCKKEQAGVTGIYFTNIEKGSVSMNEGETFRAKYIVEPYERQETAEIEWTTSKNGVATVKNGRVTAVSVGTAEITATSGSASASFTVTVVPFEVTAFKLQSSVNGYVGEGIPVEVTDIVPEAATAVSIEWSIDKTDVATCYVSGGQLFVKGYAEGVAVLTGKGVGVTHTCQLSFQKYVPVQSVAIDPEGPVTMYYKNLANLECVITPAAASLADVTWKVVAPDGLFTGVHPNGTTLGLEAGVMDGEAIITATAENKSASIKVKVVCPPVTDLNTPSAVRLSPTSDFGRKPTETLSVTRKPAESISPITYTSSDTNIATVDANGVVTAKGHGRCYITVSADDVKRYVNVYSYKKSSINFNLEYWDGDYDTKGERVYVPYDGKTLLSGEWGLSFRYFDPASRFVDYDGVQKTDYEFYKDMNWLYDLLQEYTATHENIGLNLSHGKGQFWVYSNVFIGSLPANGVSDQITLWNELKDERIGNTFTINVAFKTGSISFFKSDGTLINTIFNGGSIDLSGVSGDVYAIVNGGSSPSHTSYNADASHYFRYKEGNSYKAAFDYDSKIDVTKHDISACILKVPRGQNLTVTAYYAYNPFSFTVK